MIRIRMTKDAREATVVTHGGIFHADEVMATVVLAKVFGDLAVLRTFKVPEDLAPNVVVYDIGGCEFDHHQQGGNGTRKNGVPYSSCGLIWKKFGHNLVAGTENPKLVWELIDRDLIQGIDAADNGTMPAVSYPVQTMSISKVISSFNPQWDSKEDPDECFIRAFRLAEAVFDNSFAFACSKAKAERIVESALENSEEGIMILDRFVPWQEFVFSSQNSKAASLQFVVYPSNRGGYNWQCVPDVLGGFGQRKPVPTAWRGLKGAELQNVTGIKTATFCHPGGFIGGADTLEDAIALSKLASQN